MLHRFRKPRPDYDRDHFGDRHVADTLGALCRVVDTLADDQRRVLAKQEEILQAQCESEERDRRHMALTSDLQQELADEKKETRHLRLVVGDLQAELGRTA